MDWITQNWNSIILSYTIFTGLLMLYGAFTGNYKNMANINGRQIKRPFDILFHYQLYYFLVLFYLLF